MVVVLRFDPMLLITILLSVGDKAKDRLGVTGSQASATLPHRKISGSPALIPVQGPGQQQRSQPQTVALLPTPRAAHLDNLPHPHCLSPISIQPLGSHKGSSHPTTV